MAGEPIPYYPETPCHMAPLRPGAAPAPDCECRICDWANRRAVVFYTLSIAAYGPPITPGTRAWDALLEAAR